MKRFFTLGVLLAIVATACSPKQGFERPADWGNTVVYEMNVRQYTPEGTFAAAAEHLPRLKELGVDVVWLMPIYPIGVLERKGTLGSYYAISDYCATNPEFGSLEEFDAFLAKAHEEELFVVLDWVANHTSPDAKWINESPADWYVRDENGKTIVQYDWTDIAKLNYDNHDMRAEMEKSMRFWLDRGVDGFRCDMACEVPFDFWQTTIPALRKDYKNIYMLAEGEHTELHVNSFDASYSWELHHLLNAIARGEKDCEHLIEYVEKDMATYPKQALRLMFTSNHDENSWAGTEFERMGDAAKVMAMLTFTLPNGQPLIYTGQEMGWNKRFEFFEKDNIPAWEQNEYETLYKELTALRHANPALAAGVNGGNFELVEDVPQGVFAFTRSVEGNSVTVYANLTSKPLSLEENMLAPWGWSIVTINE